MSQTMSTASPNSGPSSAAQFFLRWNNYTSNILQVFMEQLTSENLVDITLSCEGQFIKAHKMVLSACSPYFNELFQIHNVPHPVVIMSGVRFGDLKQVIEFMYRGEVKVLETDLNDVLAVAESLRVKGLSNVRKKYEKGDIQNADPTIVNLNESSPEAKKRKLDDLVNTSNISNDATRSDSGEANMNIYCNAVEENPGKEELASIKTEAPEVVDIEDEDSLSSSLLEMNKMVDQVQQQIEDHCGVQTTQPASNTSHKELPLVSIAMKLPLSVDEGSKATLPGNVCRLPLLLPKLPGPFLLQRQVTPSRQIVGIKRSNINKPEKNKIPRPPNAFMIFANKWRKQLASAHKYESNAEISCRLGLMWKSLEKEEKDSYYEAARQADQEHKEKYPGYVYNPQEARLRKYNQANSKSLKSDPVHCPIQFVQVIPRLSLLKGDLRRDVPNVRGREVYMTGENQTSTPVMIALDNPETPVEMDKSFSRGHKKKEDIHLDMKVEEVNIDIKEEIIDSCDETVIKTEREDVGSTSNDDPK